MFTLFFTIELVMRYCASRQNDQPFLSDPYVWFDVIAIIPFYVIVLVCFGNPFSESCDLRSAWLINVLQATKILRIFKISRVRLLSRIPRSLWLRARERGNGFALLHLVSSLRAGCFFCIW